MFVTSRCNLLIILFLSTIICVSSTSTSNNDQQENELVVRERRQLLPLLPVLSPLLGGLLAGVQGLLAALPGAVQVILVQLGLALIGLSNPVKVILTQVTDLVSILLQGRKRRVISEPSFPNITSANVVTEYKKAQACIPKLQKLSTTAQKLDITVALTNVVNLIKAFQTTLSLPTITKSQLQNGWKGIETALMKALKQLETAIASIIAGYQGCTIQLTLLSVIPTLLLAQVKASILGGTGFAQVTLILENIAIVQNMTMLNQANLYGPLATLCASVNNILTALLPGIQNAINGLGGLITG